MDLPSSYPYLPRPIVIQPIAETLSVKGGNRGEVTVKEENHGGVTVEGESHGEIVDTIMDARPSVLQGHAYAMPHQGRVYF